MRYLFLLAIAIGAGYAIGYRDARQHDKSVVERVIDRVENANHDRMSTDADKKLDEIEHR